ERPAAKPVRVTLIGASIGKAWNLPELGMRAQSPGYMFEALQAWEYDKSDVLEEVLMRPARKFRLTRTYIKSLFEPAPPPADVVILKECSAYFPGDLPLARKQELLRRWVREIQEKHIRVMLATTVPVTRQRSAQDPGKQQGLLAFNDWLRGYARDNRIPLLDLEAALRTDDRERYLRDDFSSDDCSHLIRTAYEVLDRVMLSALCELGASGGCPS